MVIKEPNQLDPRGVNTAKKFVQVFDQQDLVLKLKIQDTKPPMFLRSADSLPGSKRKRCGLAIPLRPKTMSSRSVNFFDETFRELERTEIVNG